MLSLLAIIVLSLVTLSARANWAIANGSDFQPTNGTLSYNKSYQVSDDVFAKIHGARGYTSRLNTLAAQNDSNIWKFNFNPALDQPAASKGAGGVAILASSETMGALWGTGVAHAMGFLEPCGVNAPHYHPFATQLVTVVYGGPLKAGAIWSNAAKGEMLSATVNTWEMIVLPQGSIHWVFNDNCHKTITSNSFSSQDPGILNAAPTLFKMDPGVVNGTLGYQNLDPTYISQHIPPSYVLGAKECLQRCGIQPDIGSPPAPASAYAVSSGEH